LVNEQVRSTCILYRFSIKADQQIHTVIAKKPLTPAERNKATNGALQGIVRPQLTTNTDPKSKVQLEFVALSKIDQQFGASSDARFGAIHPLAYLPELPAILMEEAKAPNLRQLLMQTHRFQWSRSTPNLLPVFQHAGAWLHTYHQLPNADHTQTRHRTRQEFVAVVQDFCAFLTARLGNQHFFQTLATTVARLADQHLPTDLPLGLGHGDYATRNILVGPAAQVTVLDTLCKWQTPIYEDIGYFLMRLKAAGPQALSQGVLFNPKELALYETAFLRGYWDATPIPYAAVKLFEMQALLDYWSSQVTLSPAARLTPSFKVSKKQVQTALVRRFLYTYSHRLLATLTIGISTL
jgi:aminoglycoside phosphotransferase (APT) family kinase protein